MFGQRNKNTAWLVLIVLSLILALSDERVLAARSRRSSRAGKIQQTSKQTTKPAASNPSRTGSGRTSALGRLARNLVSARSNTTRNSVSRKSPSLPSVSKPSGSRQHVRIDSVKSPLVQRFVLNRFSAAGRSQSQNASSSANVGKQSSAAAAKQPAAISRAQTNLAKNLLIRRFMGNRSSSSSVARPSETQQSSASSSIGKMHVVSRADTEKSSVTTRSGPPILHRIGSNLSNNSQIRELVRKRLTVTKTEEPLNAGRSSRTAPSRTGQIQSLAPPKESSESSAERSMNSGREGHENVTGKWTINRLKDRQNSARSPESEDSTAARNADVNSSSNRRETLIRRIQNRLRADRDNSNSATIGSDASQSVGNSDATAIERPSRDRTGIGRLRKIVETRLSGRRLANREPGKIRQEEQARAKGGAIIGDGHNKKSGAYLHSHERSRLPRLQYHDRPHLVSHGHRHVHMYRDRRDRVCHKIIGPRYRFIVSYSFGPSFVFRYVHPYYHRKYIFVSLGGYWPVEYSYVRYYWYGCHPYIWCGYYPVAREIQGDTYNYYTYNYYGIEGDGASQSICDETQEANYIEPVDHTTFQDVREKLAKQSVEPALQTQADIYFEEAVKVFENGDYDAAGEKLAAAMELAPEDMILPFAYSQALFANEQYSEAAEVLREALSKATPDEQGIFYPRGLYPDDDVLVEQIERLIEKLELSPFDADLQLLLGYQLLGVGEIEYAEGPLHRASEDVENADAARVLLDLLEKIRAVSTAEQNEQ